MAKVAVDIDSTLYDFDTPAREVCFRKWEETGDDDYKRAAYHTGVEWRSYPDILGLEKWIEVIDIVHSRYMIMRNVPFAGVKDTIDAIVDMGHEIMYISNRDPNTFKDTWDWLDSNRLAMFSTFNGVYEAELVVTSDSKAPYLADCQYLIDDRVKTVVEFVHTPMTTVTDGAFDQRHAFVKAHSYNINLTDVPNCWVAPSWDGIRHFLSKVGVIESDHSLVAA